MDGATNGGMTVGIIGGMGPEATAVFLHKLIRRTPATCDQDHLHLLVDCDPGMPDRTRAILGDGESPLPRLVRSAEWLQAGGAELIAMPCVTVHAFLDELRAAARVPVLSIIEELAHRIHDRHAEVSHVGILATDGALQAGVFAPLGVDVELLTPDDAAQRDVMTAVYGPSGVKVIGPTEAASKLLERAAAQLIGAGAEVIVAGCTEIPLALAQGAVAVPLVDTLDVLAEAVVRESLRAEAPRDE